MLDQIGFSGNLAGLFYSGVDWRNAEHLTSCEYAFKNLVLHHIEQSWPEITHLVQFDDVKLKMMLTRFYRDAFGVAHFQQTLRELVTDGPTRIKILAEIERLSIRVNSPKPRKTRIAAAFSLWMATFRPLYLKAIPEKKVPGLWCLDAEVNFYLTTTFLQQFGEIEVGIPGRDRRIRLQRIYYDLTCRDVNLSSLELFYCSIFRPNPALLNETEQ